MDIQELLHSIGVSVQNAHAAIEEHTTRDFINHYFEAVQNDGSIDSFAPKMIKIELPKCNGMEAKTVYAPLASLVPHTSLHMDSFRVKLNMKVLSDAAGRFEVNTFDANTIADNSQAGELEITYKCTDTPEGIARIDTQLSNLL